MSLLEQQIQGLFKDFSPDIQKVVQEVICIEQEHIHLKRPHVKDAIQDVLERVIITNFRQYFGEQTITFATDEQRNVTVLHGVNGAGKTSLFTALN